MYWGSMMIGRWTGAISAFEFKSQTNKILTVIVPLVAFGIVIGVIIMNMRPIIVNSGGSIAK